MSRAALSLSQSGRGMWLILGLLLGLAVGTISPPMPLYGSATHGQDGFSICTAELEAGFEGLYYLDYQTGDLVGAFLHPRTRVFTNVYRVNILKDFADAKTPKFLMVSGHADLTFNITGNTRPSFGTIYIVEMNSGIAVAYAAAFPVNRTTLPAKTDVPLQKLDTFKFRAQAVREN